LKVSVEVPYRDIDAMGHLNNAVYFSYCEFARQKYWDRLVGLRGVLDIGFIMASASMEYRRPAYMGDVLEIEIHCTRIGETSFDFSYRLTRDRELVAEARSTQVLWDWSTGAKRAFSEELRRNVARLESEL
jgi:acyl-CoA thioester hydrolase